MMDDVMLKFVMGVVVRDGRCNCFDVRFDGVEFRKKAVCRVSCLVSCGRVAFESGRRLTREFPWPRIGQYKRIGEYCCVDQSVLDGRRGILGIETRSHVD